MLEKPDIPDDRITACVQAAYGLDLTRLTFLPLGADRNTAVYRAWSDAGRSFFVKLRSGSFNATSVLLPGFLAEQGIPHIIAPWLTRTGKPWTKLAPFQVIVYPFVQGRDGYESTLTDQQWVEFGRALKRIHTCLLPGKLLERIVRESYPPQGRRAVQGFLDRVEREVFNEPLERDLAAFLKTKSRKLRALVGRAGRLAEQLQAAPGEFVLCHSDLHAGNLLIQDSGRFFIVDWDDPILAPVERDLMFVGGGQFGAARSPREEELLFYQGYGQVAPDPLALAYYRHERIIQDIAVECGQIFGAGAGGEDRQRAFEFLLSNFQPDGVIAIACASDQPPGRG